MLKLSVPSVFTKGACRGQVAYGVEEFERIGEELLAQKWVAALSKDGSRALTVMNSGTYGFDFSEGELRLSLLRSPAYAGHPVGSKPIVPQNRFRPRIDIGERTSSFWINGGNADDLLSAVDRNALVKNETPMVLCCCPSGKGQGHVPGVILDDEVVQMTTFKIAENENRLVLRLFEPTGQKRSTRVEIPSLNLSFAVSLKKFEIKTFSIDLQTKEIIETDLLERSLNEKG
jgi:alpha-mannosidase